MKKLFVLGAILSAAVLSNVSAQVTPPGAGDKDLRDNNIKGRSNELERIDREMKKDAAKKRGQSAVNPAAPQQPEDKLAAKYDEIKTDYEQIQLSQDSIIKAYQSGDKVDYAQISKFSQEVNKSALRLNLNLFPAPVVENIDVKKEEKVPKKTKGVRDLIVDLDNAVGSFATSPMFQNLRVIDTSVSEKTKSDLEKIIELSELLNAEAAKMARGK